jgi:hypothetical protein
MVMNLCQRNNSPGNLRYAKQKEAIGEVQGFASFPDAPAGWRALARQVELDQKRGLTIAEFISKYAPPNENNTSTYLDFVCLGLSASPSDLLSDYSRYAISGLIAAREGYFALPS